MTAFEFEGGGVDGKLDGMVSRAHFDCKSLNKFL
jgi:hypothetical protein